MNVEELREYCIKLPFVEEGFPFGNDTLVFKVVGKIFLILSLDTKPPQFNIKCDPQKAIKLREAYSSVLPGFHMNKKHWNTVVVDGSVRGKTLQQWIDESYQLVYNKLPLKAKVSLTA